MNKIIIIIGIIAISYAIPSMSYEGIPLAANHYSSSLYNNKKPRTRKEAVQFMQSFFIKKILTEPAFKKMEIFIDEDIDYIDVTQSDMINDLLAKEMADKLAKMDLLKFEEKFLPKDASLSRKEHIENNLSNRVKRKLREAFPEKSFRIVSRVELNKNNSTIQKKSISILAQENSLDEKIEESVFLIVSDTIDYNEERDIIYIHKTKQKLID